MSPGGIPVIKFLFTEDLKVLNEALSLKQVYDIEEFDSANDMATFLSTIPAGLVIVSLREKNDLIQIATFMKTIKKVAKETALKVVVINFSGQKIFENAIAKLGIQDTIDLTITTKALKFKIDFWMKSLKGQVKVPGAAPQQKGRSQEHVANEKKVDLTAPQWIDPLQVEDDIWILKSESDCKRILSKWLVRMMGPGPNVGQWYEVRHGLWRFDLRPEEKELFVSGKGAWFFTGDQKPDFVWKENSWMMSGHTFELFYKEGSSVHSRLKSRNKILEIAENSLFAKTKEAIIIESFNKEMVFRKETQVLEDLEGKDKTDQLKHGPLAGETSLLDELDRNLSGKTSGEDELSKFWSGKLSQNTPRKQGELKLKTGLDVVSEDTERERNEQTHEKFYKNQNEFEEPETGPLQGVVKQESVQKYYQGTVGQQEEEQGPLSGKINSSSKDVAPFLTLAEEKELDEITADAKVTSFLVLNDRKVSCQLDDYYDDKVVFQTDDPSFDIASEVELDLLYEALTNDAELKIEGNVVTIDSDGDGENYITIEISKEHAEKLQNFMSNFEVRQQNINQFMKKVKGF